MAIDAQTPVSKNQQYIAFRPLLSTVDASQLTADSKEQFKLVAAVVSDLDRAATARDRNHFLQEFLFRSQTLLKDQPDLRQVWALRAIASIELNRPEVGRDAYQQLARLRARDSDDPGIQGALAALERKEWTAETASSHGAVIGHPDHARLALLTDSQVGPAKVDQVAFNAKWGAYDAYLQQMMVSIQSEWDRILDDSRKTPPPNTTVTVKLTLAPSGKVTGIVDVGSNSSDQGEQCCLNAITMAAPFGAWTDGMVATLGK